jgi:hypothetical protein
MKVTQEERDGAGSTRFHQKPRAPELKNSYSGDGVCKRGVHTALPVPTNHLCLQPVPSPTEWLLL